MNLLGESRTHRVKFMPDLQPLPLLLWDRKVVGPDVSVELLVREGVDVGRGAEVAKRDDLVVSGTVGGEVGVGAVR